MLELRNKAAKIADAGSTKITNTRDRMQSQPSKKINWDADIKSKPPPPPKPPRPPPPPSRIGSTNSSERSLPASSSAKAPVPPVPLRRAGSSAAPPPSLSRSDSVVSYLSAAPSGPPPTIRRDTRPDAAASAVGKSSETMPPPPRIVEPRASHGADVDRIDWTNLSPEDKQELFTWLDEFFSRHLNVAISHRKGEETLKHVQVPPGGRTPSPMKGPPPIARISRPKTPPRPAQSAGEFISSYPPPCTRGSAAEDLAYYFHPSTHWTDAWYTSDNLCAPPVRGNGHTASTFSWSHDGRTKTVTGGVLFSDLSICFYTVSWPLHAPPTDPNAAQRSARYLPRPAPWPRDALVDAHAQYGETVAAYAESFEGTGQPCARGECWDLAAEALKAFDAYDYVPPPVKSVARTHGHLLFAGRAADKGAVMRGVWRGGDDRVRRGDVVEWRSARCGVGERAWAVLGNPEHTAVIVADMVPRVAVRDGMAVKPSELGTLVVVEQSQGSPPKRGTYDLTRFEEGEIWIYRPVGMEAYVGCMLAPSCPEGLAAISV
ncbi:uncharacterized protein BXZ73DRAFT_53896 [Epithele typhae]|uniref:uncharacterized protein n=1 Tax=Epithele typhae TaxID=378194 RepID=UPI0020076916|nr:uncharacterized protein BXZ73DRAFT_53896 [Epithele typhae]KAH9916277.1 hypothetical protein BXZ73DRAFT_53896 [Epithele typhae]